MRPKLTLRMDYRGGTQVSRGIASVERRETIPHCLEHCTITRAPRALESVFGPGISLLCRGKSTSRGLCLDTNGRRGAKKRENGDKIWANECRAGASHTVNLPSALLLHLSYSPSFRFEYGGFDDFDGKNSKMEIQHTYDKRNGFDTRQRYLW